MVNYSLSAGLFIFDGDSKPSGDPIEALRGRLPPASRKPS